MSRKRASILHKSIIHLILIGILFFVFFSAMGSKLESRGVKQQVLEKEIALLIGASEVGMSFEIPRANNNGYVENIEIRDGRIFVGVDGFPSVKGYPYFSRYSVNIESDEIKFIVRIE